MSTMDDSRLFQPLKLGTTTLSHRLAMAPMTRMRGTASRVPTPLMTQFYAQRAAVPGTLLFTEGTFVSPKSAGAFPHAPGIWSPEQVAAWREVTDAVHAKGCSIWCQLFAAGWAASREVARAEGIQVLGVSEGGFEGGEVVERGMTTKEVEEMVRDFGAAARNAIEAGFDGVECHAANGYLVDQFIQPVSNRRTDAYGGSVERRSRFCEEVLRAMVDAVGKERVGLRISPWSVFQGMRGRASQEEVVAQFGDVVERAAKLDIAYLSLVESRIAGASDYDGHGGETLEFAVGKWEEGTGRPLLIAGGYSAQEARRLVDEVYPGREVVVLFGRHFTSNPDLVYRVKEGVDFTGYDRGTFYVQSAEGYVDWKESEQFLASVKA